MTLDEIIAGMEHRLGHCMKRELMTFRAEMEEMMERWDKEADTKYFTTLTMARIGLQRFATELRAKIGGGK